MLKVYADESGTHDGADVVVLSGLIESREYWIKFNRKWKAVLDNYTAKFFHYREFRKSANTSPDDPYFGWSDEKRRNFMFRLAMLTGESAVPTGGAYPTDYNRKRGLTNDAFEETIHAFYKSTLQMLNLHWPNFDGRALFIFDKCSRKEWIGPLAAIHSEYMDKDWRVGGISFENDRDESHLGLQAADLSAIHNRNNVRGYIEGGGESIFDIGIIDFIVSKNVDIAFRNLPPKKTKKLIGDLREDEAFKRSKGFTGAYVPLKHFDFKKYGYKQTLTE